MPETSKTPTRKVTSGALAGALAAILVWASKAFGGVEIPGEVGAGITVILTAITSYFVSEPE